MPWAIFLLLSLILQVKEYGLPISGVQNMIMHWAVVQISWEIYISPEGHGVIYWQLQVALETHLLLTRLQNAMMAYWQNLIPPVCGYGQPILEAIRLIIFGF